MRSIRLGHPLKAFKSRFHQVLVAPLLRWLRTLDAWVSNSRPNRFGRRWGGVLNLLGGLATIVTFVVWLYTYFLYIQAKQEAQQEKTAKEQEKTAKIEALDLINEVYRDDQLEDYERFKGVAEPFTLGTSAKIQRGETLALTGTVRFPLGCKDYWIVFLSDNLVWPKVNIRNTGLQYQQVNVRVTVPPQFQKGKVVLGCVLDKTHQQFEAWLAAGRDAPLGRPTRLDIALETNLITR